MARIFISHSGQDNAEAIRLRDWLAESGWDDVFLDLDPERGIATGERWKLAFQQAAYRCEVVLALVSQNWLASRWCLAEVDATRLMGKKIIVATFGVKQSDLPIDFADEQLVDLKCDPSAYARLKEGLKRAGLDPTTFPFEPGRRPYPGLLSLEENDAAIFFGRDGDIVRALDKLRGLARVGVDRLLILLGSSAAGKSSFLRAGHWPRLKRDDRNWLPLPVVRPERAAISGKFGLARALQRTINEASLHGKLAALDLPTSHTAIQDFLKSRHDGLAIILAVLREAHRVPGLGIDKPPLPLTVLMIDQGEELFRDDGKDEAGLFAELLSTTLKNDRNSLAILAIPTSALPLLQSYRSLAGLPKDVFTLNPILEFLSGCNRGAGTVGQAETNQSRSAADGRAA